MTGTELLAQARDLIDQASLKAHELSGVVASVRTFIFDNFGQNGLYAAYVVAGVLCFLVVSWFVRLALSTIKYIIIPSVVLALLVSLVLPLSFGAALPAGLDLRVRSTAGGFKSFDDRFSRGQHSSGSNFGARVLTPQATPHQGQHCRASTIPIAPSRPDFCPTSPNRLRP